MEVSHVAGFGGIQNIAEPVEHGDVFLTLPHKAVIGRNTLTDNALVAAAASEGSTCVGRIGNRVITLVINTIGIGISKKIVTRSIAIGAAAVDLIAGSNIFIGSKLLSCCNRQSPSFHNFSS